jgi:glycerol-3-phosphate cytidylyltransferase
MKIVITYGTFDLFHVGHVRLLKRLSNLGDRLLVGISSDQFNKSKGKKSFFTYEQRAEIVKSCKYVFDVFPEDTWDQKREDIVNYSANVFAMGDDWKGKFDNLSDICEVKYLPRTLDISTSEIKTTLSKVDDVKLNELEESIHNLVDLVRIMKQ